MSKWINADVSLLPDLERGNSVIAHRIIENPEYTLLKSKHGNKAYIPAVLFLGKRRNLHRIFARASDAMAYRERITRRLDRK